MLYATPLKPRERRPRPAKDITRWKTQRASWFASLDETRGFQRLFDHVPGVYFFAKDAHGHLMFASDGLLQRYRMPDDSDFIGRTDFDLNPGSMAEAYVNDDTRLLSGEVKSIERLELWWDHQGIPDWFSVTKLPLYDRKRRVAGVMGMLRRPDAAERQLPVFQTVARAVEIIRRDHGRMLLIEDVARACGQSLRQLQRRFQSTFGISPQEFLVKTRVLAAARLLEETALPANEIARRCGFVDASNFALHFRRRTGLTPLAYRRHRGTA